MRRHDPHICDLICEERLKGCSISQLISKYKLPKTTIWHYIKHLPLSVEAKDRIRSGQGGSSIRSKQDWDGARVLAKDLMSKSDFASSWPILIAALYWSEGTKKSGFVFTNTDEKMIQVFIKILREKLNIRTDDIDMLIRTCAPMDPNVCVCHWSNVTGFPVESIRVNHNDAQNKSKTKYGICRITLRKGGRSLKLMHCLITEITDRMLIP